MSHRVWQVSATAILILAGAIIALAATCWMPLIGSAHKTMPPISSSGRSVAAHSPAKSADILDDAIWPCLFGPQHDSTARGALHPVPPWGPTGPTQLWRTGCGTGYSSPIVWHDNLILLHRLEDQEIVSCLDVGDGHTAWEQRYPTIFECGSHYTNGPYSTPVTDGLDVFTLGAEGKLHCWALIDGTPRWSRNLTEEFGVPTGIFGVGHSPLLWDDRLILNVGGSDSETGVIAFHKESGEILWQSTSAGPAFATPQPARVHGRDWLLVLTKQGLSLLDANSGAEQWSIPFEPRIPDSANAVTPLVSGDLALISAWGVGTRVLRIAPDGGYTDVWESRRTLTSQYTPNLAVNDCVIGVHALDNSLRCVNLTSGDLQWRWKSELANSKNIVVGDRIILFGEYGHLGLIECRTDELRTLSITDEGLFGGDNRCYSAPAYADGRLYVRSESEVMCLDLQP